MTKEVLTLALEALKYSDTVFYPRTSIAIAAIERALAQPEQGEPFGYFKAEPFGWTDCAETDEGAIALYEVPQRTEPVCPECKAGVLYECVACSSNNYPPQRKENK
jgi:hypothetical protein